ncbi:flippase-like domain-containing protein [Solihabitans fulvus]|uniref:Flippase-like domain-containing protein n=1 Tax=Solihabitans fulvus TaxID=1892852 RepID=A0A5B2WQH2_9PSEU|nr:lysylphosphatidylglycerol synthase transmembrane domain-containing protein [Solihabitans fulvus]KAA2252689.1 flippase-like domain-containing protein [Solihabitans fulvus]
MALLQDGPRGPASPMVTPSANTVGSPSGRLARLKWVVWVALGTVLVVEAVLAGPTLAEAVQALAQPNLGWLALAVAAEWGSMAAFARMRRRLLRAGGVHVTVRSALTVVYAANALHLTLPAGSAFSTTYMYRRMRAWGASTPVAAWTMLAGGVVSTGTLAVVGLLGAAVDGTFSETAVNLLVEGIGAVALVVGLRLAWHRPEHIVAGVNRVLGWVNRVWRRPLSLELDALRGVLDQLRSVRGTARDWTATSMFSMLNWVFDLACLAACCLAVGVHGLSPGLLLVTYAAGMFVSGLGLVPGGLGVVEAALTTALVAGGVPAQPALAAVVLYRLLSFAGVVVLGWGAWLALNLSDTRAASAAKVPAQNPIAA